MGAPVFLVEDPASLADAAPGDIVPVTGPEGHHASAVLRLRDGDEVELVDGRGRRIGGVVAQASRDRIDVRATRVVDEPEPMPRIVAVQALAKGDRGELAVELLTEVGADEIVPWAARRCVARWTGDRERRGLERWRASSRAATKQSRRARLPVIEGVRDTEGIAALVAQASLAILLDAEAPGGIAAVAVPGTGGIVVIVGPEGGVDPEERDRLVAAGALAVRLGPGILRTSTAGAVACGILLARTPRWSG
ncbi:MAG: 16S rRNA (uracil(1498)-N(3))-methyltransferase [bacterium]